MLMQSIKSAVAPLLTETVRQRLSYYRRRVVFRKQFGRLPKAKLRTFRCNICGLMTTYPRDKMSREIWSCVYCGSNVRWRSIIHALSTELFGHSMALPDFPSLPEIKGIGLSDWEGYARPLARKLGYTNTFYHKAPLLDITSIEQAEREVYDFIISSDVFEHISQPISRAFENACRLLKPGGFMIFTVPYIAGETKEHFPELTTFTIGKAAEDWVLTGKTCDGRNREFTGLTFHGGPGTTVEFRLFGTDSLSLECARAGFDPVRIHDETVEEFGIYWNAYNPEQAPYRPLIFGLDTPPWTLVKGTDP